MERIAVSGSSGFLGGRLAQRLEQSEQVLRLDRTGNLPEGIDTVYDLASFGNAYDQKQPQEIYKANIMRVVRMLDQAQDQRIILTSSNAVKLEHTTFYTASKLAVEKLAEAFVNERGLKVCTVRPFSITGIGEQEGHLIPKLINSCLYGTEIPFVPDPVHDFLDVDDFVSALLLISKKGQFSGEIYEVGSGIQHSNDEVRLLVEEVTGKKANIRKVENMRSYDAREWVANNERICSLGWEPKKTLRQSIVEMAYA